MWPRLKQRQESRKLEGDGFYGVLVVLWTLPFEPRRVASTASVSS